MDDGLAIQVDLDGLGDSAHAADHFGRAHLLEHGAELALLDTCRVRREVLPDKVKVLAVSDFTLGETERSPT